MTDMLKNFGLKNLKFKESASVLMWEAYDKDWLEILADTAKELGLKVTLLGQEEKIKSAGVDLTSFTVISTNSPEDGLKHIESAQSEGSVDVLIRGEVGIKDSLKALFAKEVGFRQGKNPVSGVSIHYVEDIGRWLVVSDPIVNPTPDLTKKIGLINNTVSFAHKLGKELPKVAMLAAVEVVYPIMPHTVEGAALAKMSDRGQIKGCLVDGPLSMDVAVIESAAKGKGVKGDVAGQADVLVAPNIETAYGMYKAFSKFVGTPSAALVVGGKVPYVCASRADNRQTKENSLLMALLT